MATITPIAGSDTRYWWIFLLRALLFLVAGFLTLRYPLESYLTLGVLFGVTMLLTGVVEVVFALSRRKSKGWGWRLFSGIVDLVLGVLLVLNIGLTMTVLPIFVGVWFLFRGVTLLSLSGVMKESRSRPWLIAGGVLMILVSIVMVIFPVIGAIAIITWTAVGFVMAGIFNIVLAMQLKGLNKDEKKGFELAKS